MSESQPSRHEESLDEANQRLDRSRTWALVLGGGFLGLLLLCVIAGPLASLLVQRRESARRTTCANHLRELGFQMETYYNANNAFPSGWVISDGAMETVPAWGWPSQLVSLTDASYPTPDDLNTPLGTVSETGGERLELLQEAMDGYLCPSDKAFTYEGENHPERRWDPTGTPIPWGLSMYVGNAGHKHDAVGTEPNTGIFFGNSAITLDDITDGISFTVMLGERDLTNCRAGSWPGVPDPMRHDGGPSIWNVVAGAKPKINAPPWDGDTLCGEGYSSFHPGGVNMLLVDGAVKFFTDDTDSQWHDDPKSGQLGVLQQFLIRDNQEEMP
ncbi:DUF1559 domain-containing protein [Bremerella cremea]|uniref:DUF1559 family PulG-like putative transporter n=1 Tax=Bremerella cremea TaxID=1031537 RepID=UPI0031EFF34F